MSQAVERPWRLPHPQETLAEYLRSARRERGTSLDSMVRATGMSLSALRKIEDGRTLNPGLFTLHQIWLNLDLPWEALGLVAPSVLHRKSVG